MFEVSWLLFAFASLVLIVAPGQDMILVMSRPQVLAWLYRSSAAVLVGLGLKLAFERRS